MTLTSLSESVLHAIFQRPVISQIQHDEAEVFFGMGCFWGAERLFWNTHGVTLTGVGYGGGTKPHPTYREVCSGLTGHAELVRVVYCPQHISLIQLLEIFWTKHDPTQGNRQGNDVGTQYRSVIGVNSSEDRAIAHNSLDIYSKALQSRGHNSITTEVVLKPIFYFAEENHQQYLFHNPNGYCGLKGTGVACVLDAHEAL